MLAAMTFPSPPKSTPGHSPTSSITSVGSRPPSAQAVGPPVIRARTSSLRSKSNQALSLDEVVMQSSIKTGSGEPSGLAIETPEAVRSRSPSQTLSTPVDKTIDEEIEPVDEKHIHSADLSVQVAAGGYMPATEVALDVDKEEPLTKLRCSSSASTTKPDRCESSVSFYTADESYRSLRNSVSSGNLDFTDTNRFSGTMDSPYDISGLSDSYRQSTTTDDSYRQSGMTDTSNRQSTRSDMTAATDLSLTPEDNLDKRTEDSGTHTQPSTELPGNYVRKHSIANSFDSYNDNNSCPSERSGTPSSLYSTLTEEGANPRSILERRLARKAKVREYKQKDLASVRTSLLNPLDETSAVDSPVLGWFTQNSAKSKRMSSSGPSPLSRGIATATTSSSTTPTTPTPADRTPGHEDADGRTHNSVKPLSGTPKRSSMPALERNWTISPV
ncbi:hypothetical protein Micbo1qcDRAFT_158829, partial [Microdochium bolleyi]